MIIFRTLKIFDRSLTLSRSRSFAAYLPNKSKRYTTDWTSGQYLSAIISAISEAKREALSPQDVSQHAKEAINRITSDESSISSRGATKGELKAEAKERIKKCERTALFADVYASYEVQKQKAGLMDFNDLIIELLAALENDELLLRLIQERFLYILVDEHQDTKTLRILLCGSLLNSFDTPNVFVVAMRSRQFFDSKERQ